MTTAALDGKTSCDMAVDNEDESKNEVLSAVAAWQPSFPIPEEEVKNVFTVSIFLYFYEDICIHWFSFHFLHRIPLNVFIFYIFVFKRLPFCILYT